MEESVIKGITVMGKRYTKHTVTNFVIPNYTTISELFEEIECCERALLRRGMRVIFIAGDDERFHAAIYKVLDDPEEIEHEELRVKIISMSEKVFKSSISAAEWALKQK